MAFQKILAALDDTALGRKVFTQSLELATMHRAQLLLLHSFTEELVPKFLLFPGEMGFAPQLISQVYQWQQSQTEAHSQQIQVWLEALENQARREGVAVQSCIQSQEPGQAICQIATFWKADVIVMGRRGRRGLTEMLLGSTSNHVLHHAPCPVLVVQGEGEAIALNYPPETVSL